MSGRDSSISLRSLECFRSIIQTGSVTAAAARMGLTQPAVSRMLGQLEQRIGFPLFHRAKGRLFPTEEALAYHREVDIALQAVERLDELAGNLGNANFGELSIVAPPSLGETILPPLIARFLADHPNVYVSLDSQPMETARDMVALRACDCGFARLPIDHPGVRVQPLIRTGSACVLPRDHVLASRARIAIADLRDQPLVLLGRGRQSRRQIEDAFRAERIRPVVRVETHTVGSACALVRDGVGIAIVNEMLGLQYRGEGTVLRPLSPRLNHEYAFMTSTDAAMTRVAARFLAHCQAHFNEQAGRYRLS